MEIEMLDAPEVREEPTAIQQTSIALVQGALTEFHKVEAGLADLRTKYANVVYAVNTAAGMAEAKAARQALRAPRYAVDKILKATKEPLNQIKKDLDARAGRITAAILVFEDPIDGQIKAEEDRKAAEKAERERVAAAPVILEPAAGAAEIIAQAEAGDVEYITAAAIDPSDADIIFCAARAVSLEYGLTFGEAIHRLAAVESWTQTEGATA